MSWKQHEDDCPGCKPALLDVKTGRPLPPDSPEMVVVNGVWGKTTLEERQAFHRVTCLNSRDKNDLRIMQEIAGRITKAFEG